MNDTLRQLGIPLLGIFQVYFAVESIILMWLFTHNHSSCSTILGVAVQNDSYGPAVFGYLLLKAILFFSSTLGALIWHVVACVKTEKEDSVLETGIFGFGYLLFQYPLFQIYSAIYNVVTLYGLHLVLSNLGSSYSWHNFIWVSTILDVVFNGLLIKYYYIIKKMWEN
jgi:hypothetical protein